MKQAEKEILNYSCTGEAADPFNGLVFLFENTDLTEDKRFWVEAHRKDTITDYMSLEEAEAKFQECINDTMF